MDYRVEKDSLGKVKVEKDRYWGAQTERSRNNFKIGGGHENMPREIIRAFALLKKSAALANKKLLPSKMTEEKCRCITKVCEEILAGGLDEHFPLSVFQTGSGTHTNMNVNEVIANRGNEIAGKDLLHPNDDVNMSQSSNDTFPSAFYIASSLIIADDMLPALERLTAHFEKLGKKSGNIIKTGRTHLQDALPLRFSQEVSGWTASLKKDYELIEKASKELCFLAIGGTAVGTGLNAPEGFGEEVAMELNAETAVPFESASNKFHSLSSFDEAVFAHGALKALAGDLMKIANDIRWLSSGPRTGLGEITIPYNEPGSSIMPGKVNPTQCEQVTMMAVQVMGNDAAIGFAASQGNFELNVFLPVMAYNFIQSARLLTDSMNSFGENCVKSIVPNREKMEENAQKSLMSVTALTPVIGYEKAAEIAQKAFRENKTLKEAAAELGYISGEDFEKIVNLDDICR